MSTPDHAERPASVLPTPRQLLHFGPRNGSHKVGLRAGISMAVPLLVLWATGHVELSLYAAFGAFTSVYGRTHTHRSRVLMQCIAGGILVTGVTLGSVVATFAGREWMIVPVAAVYGCIASVISDGVDFHPPGPLFPVFSIAAVASAPADVGRIPTALLISAGAAGFAILIGGIGYLRPRSRELPETQLTVSVAQTARNPRALRRAATVLVAIAIAGVIPTAAGLAHPYWSMVAAAAATSGVDTTAKLTRGLQRILGTAVGVAVAAALFTTHPSHLVLILIVGVGSGFAEMLVGRNYGVALTLITPIALSMVQVAHPVSSSELIGQRMLETFIGAAVGIALTLVLHYRGSRRRPMQRNAVPRR